MFRTADEGCTGVRSVSVVSRADEIPCVCGGGRGGGGVHMIQSSMIDENGLGRTGQDAEITTSIHTHSKGGKTLKELNRVYAKKSTEEETEEDEKKT